MDNPNKGYPFYYAPILLTPRIVALFNILKNNVNH